MKVFIRIIVYTAFILLTGFMIYIMNLDVDLYSTEITPKTIQLFNPQNGRFFFLKTWRLIKTAYYDTELNQQDWQYWKDRYKNKINSFDDASIAINTMLASLDDPYSIFLNKDEFEEQMNQIDSKITGIGVHITVESGNIVIFSVVDNSPAQKVGLKDGDIIIKVNNTDVQGLSISTVASLIRGEKGSLVKVTVMRNKKKIEKTMTRDDIKIENISRKMIDGYTYIQLYSFIADTLPEEFDKAIEYAKNNHAKGYIIDLRGNTGGLLSNAIYISNLFMEKGNIVYIVNRNEIKNAIAAKNNPNAIKEPVVILINPLSASASEIFSGAMKDNKRAVLVGETTFGKGLVQKVYSMPNSTGLNLTISKYLTPNGTDIHKIGIKPDYPVNMNYRPKKQKDDIQLQKALEIIKKMK